MQQDKVKKDLFIRVSEALLFSIKGLSNIK